MTIVWGTNSFLIKQYTPAELGIKYENGTNIQFEVRQRYFHFFWIPAFPIGKLFVYREKGKLYNLPEAYVQIIQQREEHKTPWYSFALPLLIVVGLLLAGGSLAYDQYSSDRRAETQHENLLAAINKEAGRLTTNHYIWLYDVNDAEREKPVLLKVVAIYDSTVTCVKLDTSLSRFETLPVTLQDYYWNNAPHLKRYSFTRREIADAIKRNYNAAGEKDGKGISLQNGILYSIDKMEYIDGPSIIPGVNHVDTNLLVELKNIGEPAKLVEIKNLDNSLKWLTKLPMEVRTDENFSFALEAPLADSTNTYKIILVFTDYTGKKYNFIVSGRYPEYEAELVERVF